MIRVAVAMGGFSPEREISLQSGKAVLESLNPERYEAYALDVSPSGWVVLDQGEAYELDASDVSWVDSTGIKKRFDAAFIAIHGSPGEDGPLQAYFDLIGLPYTGSGFFEMALTFSKSQCNSVLRDYGLPVADAELLFAHRTPPAAELVQKLGLPFFVKPNRSGSSFGVSKVKTEAEVETALKRAFEHGDQAVAERFVAGIELGCGVSDHSGRAELLGITEIVPEREFFDYEAKYEGASQEITPARIPVEQSSAIGAIALDVYRRLNLKGVVRVDFILSPDLGPFIIEINAVPGLGPESIVPKQMKAAGIDPGALFGALIDRCISKHRS
jgi:D-alanine-D-alanine ligase